ncbi:MAG: caspase family protein [Saprospiraceae bacterium]|nr:caspase family protein [Saprospiraceae bacterium]
MKPIYALLVGIDTYPPAVPKLSGSKKDVHKIKSYLESNFGDRPLHIKTLLDEEASYGQLIEQFRSHLGQAGPDDVVWFHYSGHGSRQFSAPEFVQLNSGKKDETLVLHDSRPGGVDLADKELAVLLNELSTKNPHILVTLDCCHSGSGTRGADEYIKRLSVDRGDIRTIDSYLNGFYKTRGTDVPQAKYIFYAACNRFQSAKETFTGGGLFTDVLIKTLSKTKKDISYAQLLIKLRQEVVAMKWDQDPQLEIVGEMNSYSQFLDGAPVPNAPKYAVKYIDETWMMEAGQILGISDEFKLVLYHDQSNDIISKAKVSKSTAQSSIIIPEKELDKSTLYWAVPINLPLPFEVGLKVEDQYLKRFEEEASKVSNVRYTTDQVEEQPYFIIQNGDNFELNDKIKNRVLFFAKIKEPTAMYLLTDKLTQISSWTRIFSLQNNKSILSDTAFKVSLEVKLEEGAQNYTPGEVNIKTNNQKVPYKLWIQNQFTQPLNFLLIYLSDHYGAIPLKNEPLEKADAPTLFWGGGENDYFIVPADAKVSNDNFLIIISTERTDDIYFQLEELVFGELKPENRAIPGLNRNTKFTGEWCTSRFVINLE